MHVVEQREWYGDESRNRMGPSLVSFPPSLFPSSFFSFLLFLFLFSHFPTFPFFITFLHSGIHRFCANFWSMSDNAVEGNMRKIWEFISRLRLFFFTGGKDVRLRALEPRPRSHQKVFHVQRGRACIM